MATPILPFPLFRDLSLKLPEPNPCTDMRSVLGSLFTLVTVFERLKAAEDAGGLATEAVSEVGLAGLLFGVLGRGDSDCDRKCSPCCEPNRTGIDMRTKLLSFVLPAGVVSFVSYVDIGLAAPFDIPLLPGIGARCAARFLAGDSIVVNAWNDFANVVNSAKNIEDRSHITVFIVVRFEYSGLGTGIMPSGNSGLLLHWW
jgi:hypothetical protein